jgi:hypothetical protein
VKLTELIRDFRLYILLFAAIRLIGITNPPAEVHHGWRQAGTLMMVRAMEDHGPKIFYPGSAVAGADRWQVIASEMPLYTWTIYASNLITGEAHWMGRLISLIACCIGVWSFYRITRRLLGEQRAFFAGIILLSSLWFMFGRKVMPDIFSASLVLAGIELAWMARMSGKFWIHIPSFALIAVGLLAKMPSVALLVFLIPLFADAGASLWQRGLIAAYTALAVILMGVWYFVWVPELLRLGAFQLYWPKTVSEGWSELIARPQDTISRFTFTTFYSYTAFATFIAGIFMIRKERWALRITGIAALILLAIYMLKVGDCIPEHDYYMIPFAPVMALVAALGFGTLERWPVLSYLIAAVIAVEGFANQQHDLRLPEEMQYKMSLADELDQWVPKDEPVAIVGDLNPQDMYFSKRKGWMAQVNELNSPEFRERLRVAGCRFIVVNSHRNWLRNVTPENTELIFQGNWRIYSAH